jgi:hypothetical protein
MKLLRFSACEVYPSKELKANRSFNA